MTESRSDRAYRTFVEVIEEVEDKGTNAERQAALEAIDAILYAQLGDSETRALVGAISRSVLAGEVANEDYLEYTKTVDFIAGR